jgi:hypothetical protein
MQNLHGNKITYSMFPEVKLHSVISVEIMSFWSGFVKVGWLADEWMYLNDYLTVITTDFQVSIASH